VGLSAAGGCVPFPDVAAEALRAVSGYRLADQGQASQELASGVAGGAAAELAEELGCGLLDGQRPGRVRVGGLPVGW
jgi:hypothetical protein